jgi:spermidine/putrescine transport system substrate-binding protein
VHLSRRELLTAAAGLLASGCAVRDTAGSGPQTIAPPDVVTKHGQALDPRLRLSLPAGAIDPANVHRFEAATKVAVTMRHQPSMSELLLDLAAGAQGSIDVALVDGPTLTYLIQERLVEPIDRTLVPNLQWLGRPFADPPYDPGSGRSVGKDYSVIGYAVSVEDLIDPADTWRGLFRLAASVPGSVAVPDDPVTVVGAALLASGHAWSSSSRTDLDDARTLLVRARQGLDVDGGVDRRSLGRHHLAAICTGLGFRKAGDRTKFVVPLEGTVIRMRSYCILALAPDPVSAHAWLNAALDPFTARRDVLATRIASTVDQTDYLLPSAVLDDPAIYPPPGVSARIRFPTVSPAAAAARSALWEEVRP